MGERFLYQKRAEKKGNKIHCIAMEMITLEHQLKNALLVRNLKSRRTVMGMYIL